MPVCPSEVSSGLKLAEYPLAAMAAAAAAAAVVAFTVDDVIVPLKRLGALPRCNSSINSNRRAEMSCLISLQSSSVTPRCLSD